MTDLPDLSKAVSDAAALSRALGQEPVLSGALAMAAHGYVRETTDVDIVLAVPHSEEEIIATARDLGLALKARHSFGDIDFRTLSGQRIDVLTLTGDLAGIVADSTKEAIASGRIERIFGSDVYVVSLGNLVTLKLIASRRKDLGDIVEIMKALMTDGRWGMEKLAVLRTVRDHIGWYAATRTLGTLEDEARQELGDLP